MSLPTHSLNHSQLARGWSRHLTPPSSLLTPHSTLLPGSGLEGVSHSSKIAHALNHQHKAIGSPDLTSISPGGLSVNLLLAVVEYLADAARWWLAGTAKGNLAGAASGWLAGQLLRYLA